MQNKASFVTQFPHFSSRFLKGGFLCLTTLLMIVVGAGTATALDTVSEGDIAALFAPSASMNPILTTHTHIFIAEDNHGSIGSAAYDLGNGLFLYAYDFFCESPVTFTVTRLAIPLSTTSAPVPAGAVTSGTFWTGLGPLGEQPYTGPFAVFNPLQTFEVDAETDPITDAIVSPSSVTFVAPGIYSINNNLTLGVFLTTPVFGFITDVSPIVVTGQYATDANGNPLPVIQIVAPSGVSLLDPIPGLLSGPAVTTDTNLLATRGGVVQGVAADGVTQVVLRIPANFAGEQLALTVLNDQDNPSASTDEDGGLAKLGDIDSTTGLPNITSTLSVTADDPDGPGPLGPMAFAIYRAPMDFPRPGGLDANASKRMVAIQIQSIDVGSFSFKVPIKVVRPPVVLIHGIWSSSATWDFFQPLISDPRFQSFRVNYSKTNGDGFRLNANKALPQIIEFIYEFKSRSQAAAVQADIVTHSMGGNITRTLVIIPGFRIAVNYRQGYVHKLITLDAPHLGSHFANRLLNSSGWCKRFFGAFNHPVAGAVRDLAVGSPILQTLQGAVFPLQAHAIAGIASTNQENAAEQAFENLAWGRAQKVCSNLLPAGGFQAVFSGPSDLIVSETSQKASGLGFFGGSPPADASAGIIHTVVPLIFPQGPDALSTDIVNGQVVGASTPNPGRVIDLLNQPVQSAAFAPIKP